MAKLTKKQKALEGKVDALGMPRLLQMALTVRASGHEAYPTSMPLPVLRALTAVLAPLGRALGLRPFYPRFAS